MNQNLYESLPFGHSLAILTKSYYAALTKQLEHLEIERYYSILILIESLEKGCTQQYICDQLKMDKVSMVRIIKYLIAKKYIVKVVNELDRREYHVQLTKKSIQMLPEIHKAIDAVNDAALKGISKAKQKELHEHLSHIQSNLDQLPAETIYINYKKSSRKV